ncbi:MAG: hypothetical protein V3V06_00705 [Dehalococcoidia bacterium]
MPADRAGHTSATAPTPDADDSLAGRVWRRDPSLWPAAPPQQVATRLGWLDAGERVADDLAIAHRLAHELRAEGVRDVVLLGMGGAVHGARAVAATVPPLQGYPRLRLLDTTVPSAILQLANGLDPRRVSFVLASKSGETIETDALRRHFLAWLRDHGVAAWRRRFIVITDPHSPLHELAQADGARRVFLNPTDIGGRNSVLSNFGLVPAILSGVPVDSLLRSARDMRDSARAASIDQNPALRLGIRLGQAARGGRDKVMIFCSPRLRGFGDWLEQLLAESTGKDGKGLLPLFGDRPLDPHRYPADRQFVVVQLRGDEPAVPRGWARTLEQAGLPLHFIQLATVADVGAEFFRWAFATVVASALIGINPFDEPDVDDAKTRTRELLRHYGKDSALPLRQPAALDGALADFILNTPADQYLGVQAFLPFSPELDRGFARLRALLQESCGITCTFAYGPRFLHATGQYHKGGPPARFLHLYSSTEPSLPVPGRDYDFAALVNAQMLCDVQELRRRRRPIMASDIGSPHPGAFDAIIDQVAARAARPPRRERAAPLAQ